jgi:hypothetical protein
VRTTIDLDARLLREAKAHAAKRGTTLSIVVSDALREAFARTRAAKQPLPPLPVFDGDGLQPGVSLEDGGGLWDLHDEEAGWRGRA